MMNFPKWCVHIYTVAGSRPENGGFAGAAAAFRPGQHASLPPEADREADGQRLNVVPVLGRDVQHVTRLQHALQVHGIGKLGEFVQVGPLAVHLACVSQETGGVRVEMLGELGRVESHILLPHHLAQKVVLGVLVEGGHSAFRPEPCVDVHLLFLPQAAVHWDADVILQLRDLQRKKKEKKSTMIIYWQSFTSEICSKTKKLTERIN